MDIMNEISIYFTDLVSDEWDWDLVGINLIISITFLLLLKLKVSWFTGVESREELADKDNPAFGINLAFVFFSYLLIMSAASTGNDTLPIFEEIKLMGGYAIAGMFMLMISKLIFDKLSMKSFCLQEEIRKRNCAAAIVDGGNALATALIVFTYMGWVKGTDFQPIMIVAYGWVLSQVVLSVVSFLRAKLYKSSDGSTLQSAIQDGNIAVAIRYTAYKLSFAITPLIAAPHYPYSEDEGWWMATAIFISSLLLAFAVKILASLMKRVLVSKVDFADEINRQRNYGLACVEASFVLGLVYLFYGMLQ